MRSQSDRIAHSFQSNLLRYLRSSARKMSIGVQLAGTIGVLGVVGSVSLGQAVSAQTPIPITGISTTSSDETSEDYSTKTANPCDNGNGTAKVFACDTNAKIIFRSGTSDNLNLASVTAGGTTFTYRGLADKIQIKRIVNPQVSGDRQIIFFQNNSATNASGIDPITFNVAPSRVDTMELALLSQTINRGADNVFANNAPASNNSKNFNNIERIDYIINNGIAAGTLADSANIGFVVMDRGGNDRYAIAPILSLDGSGNPATVGAVQVFNISSAFAPLAPTAPDYLVLRREDTSLTSLLRPSDRSGSQPIGGHFVPLSKLFLTPYVGGTKVYGYVLMAPDAPTTSTAVVNLTGFPNNSEVANSLGGIDLIAGGGIFSKDPLPSNNTYTLSGNVFNDASGNKLKEAAESSVNGTTLALNAVLIGSNNIVVATTPVSATGTYTFSNVAAGTYTVRITTNTGATAATVALPNNWVTTGENLNGTIDTTADSIQSITVVAASITNIDFGIEQLPTAIGTTATAQPNPSGTTSVTVPPALFNTSTDPDSGTVDKYRITAFPNNATSFTITQGGVTTTYTSATFPAGGLAILATELSSLKVDPIDGAVNVSIPFKAIDNAGKESGNIADAIVPFTAGNKPELILLKRITKINGTTIGKDLNGAPINLTQVVAQPDNLATTQRNESGDASNPGWPTINYPQGAIDAGAVKSGDSIEYTIYFLSAGTDPVRNANFCDWVPKNTTFVPDSYGIGRGIQLAIGSILNPFTNVPDSDRGVFYNPGAILPATYPDNATYKLNCMTLVGVDGAVVVNLVNNNLTDPENQLPNTTAAGNPSNSYGFVRFVSKVK